MFIIILIFVIITTTLQKKLIDSVVDKRNSFGRFVNNERIYKT